MIMSTETYNLNDHIDEQLSGYIDGELTQQQRQRVQLHCDTCPSCSQRLLELTELRQRMGKAHLSGVGEDKWRETMETNNDTLFRGLGWLVFILGLLLAGGAFLLAFITDDGMGLFAKLTMVAIYGGLAILFVSVLLQRLRERKTDKYKDVEI